MSAEILRRAAALMRERATTAPVPRGPWEPEFSDVIRTDVPLGADGYLIADAATVAEATHIASWHPVVALAIADWLECQADTTCDCGVDESALTVARAYLGATT